MIRAVIDVDGRLAQPRVVESVPGLDEAALAAATACRFSPAVKNGKPVASPIRMPIVFRLDDSKR